MRIIAGQFRGTVIYGPKDDSVRPTSDRVREALFNILAPKIETARFLDLYSGTGAVGLEALSRGAAHVTVTELEHIDLIRKNSAKCKITTSDRFHVIRGDAIRAMRVMESRDERFDIIFADPPWEVGLEGDIVASAAAILNAGGSIVIEAFHKTEPPPAPPGLRLADSRKYGDTALYFYEEA